MPPAGQKWQWQSLCKAQTLPSRDHFQLIFYRQTSPELLRGAPLAWFHAHSCPCEARTDQRMTSHVLSDPRGERRKRGQGLICGHLGKNQDEEGVSDGFFPGRTTEWRSLSGRGLSVQQRTRAQRRNGRGQWDQRQGGQLGNRWSSGMQRREGKRKTVLPTEGKGKGRIK